MRSISTLLAIAVPLSLGCGPGGAGASLIVDIREPKSCSADGPPAAPVTQPIAAEDGGGGGGGAPKTEAPPASAFEMHATGDGAIAMSTQNLPMNCAPSPTASARLDGTNIEVVIAQSGPLAKCMCDRDLELKVGTGLAPGKYAVTVSYKSSEGESVVLTKSEVVVGR